MRKLTEKEVEFTLEIEPEWIQIEGNASAIDSEADRETKEWIRAQLDAGNQWAWCSVTVTARWQGFEGYDHLGACSFRDESDFKVSGFYDDMKSEALDNLNERIAEVAKTIATLAS